MHCLLNCQIVSLLRKIEYPGHVISKEGVEADKEKITAMENWSTPKTVKDLRGFLGLTCYYRRFISHYGSISKPLFIYSIKVDPMK